MNSPAVDHQQHPPEKNSGGLPHEKRVTTALMLAAGKGTRLRPVTGEIPKCLVDVDGKPLLARTIDALEAHGFNRLIIVTGYRCGLIGDFLERLDTTLEIQTVYNEQYDTTNNIHSLWLAAELIDEPFLLVESDLVFESGALAEMIYPDRIALSRYEPEIHHGTTARITSCGHLKALFLNDSTPNCSDTFKTVNMYSFALDSWKSLRSALQTHIDSENTDSFYELAIRDLLESGAIRLKVADLSALWWDEIDSGDDLMRVRRHLAQAEPQTPSWAPAKTASALHDHAS